MAEKFSLYHNKQDVDSFGANVYLKLDDDPSLGRAYNSGISEQCKFITAGNPWTREELGDAHCWSTAAGNSAVLHEDHHTNATSGATFTSCNATDGSAAFVITDTNNDLQALFGASSAQRSAVSRKFKIDVGCSGPHYMSGYVGTISKAGDAYTISVYNGPVNTTRSWHKYGLNSWNTTSVTWRIYPSTFEIDNSLDYGMTQMMWYYPGTDATGYQSIMGKWDYLNSGDDLFYGYNVQHSNVGGTVQISCRTNNYTVANVMPSSSRWVHLAHVSAPGVRRLYINGNIVYNSTGATYTMCLWGYFGYGRMGILSNAGIPAGSKIAFPRFWAGDIPQSTVWSVYNSERLKLGLPFTH